jgi:hypothetical protein
MELKEFLAEQKALLDEFEAEYERKRRKKSMTLFRPPSEWDQMYGDFKEIHQERSGDSDGNREDCERAA